MKGTIEYLKAEVNRGNVKICRLGNDIIVYDVESKEYMIFGWENITILKSLQFTENI
jgi:hypothetical protein